MTLSSDFALLGVPAGADEAAVRRAFLDAVKAARPDRGGDPERYRQVIAAYRRLQPAPRADLDIRIDLKVTLDEARGGGAKLVRLPTGRTVRVTLPRELSTGRTLRLRNQGHNAPGRWGDVYLRIVIAEQVSAVERVAEILRPNASVLLRRFAGTWAA